MEEFNSEAIANEDPGDASINPKRSRFLKLRTLAPSKAMQNRAQENSKRNRRSKKGLDLVPHPITSDRIYQDDEAEFLKAVECYRVKSGKKFLAACDYLHIVKSLGYMRFQVELDIEFNTA